MLAISTTGLTHPHMLLLRPVAWLEPRVQQLLLSMAQHPCQAACETEQWALLLKTKQLHDVGPVTCPPKGK
jgi:hypothetical protein